MEAIIDKAVEWFKNISEATKELTSGNVSHKSCAIRGMANRSAEYLAKHKKDYSTIKWQTGEPKERGLYLITKSNLEIDTNFYEVGRGWVVLSKTLVKAWCRLSDIEPYKDLANEN